MGKEKSILGCFIIVFTVFILETLAITCEYGMMIEKNKTNQEVLFHFCHDQSRLNQRRLRFITKKDNGKYILGVYFIKHMLLPSFTVWNGKVIAFWRKSFAEGQIRYGEVDYERAAKHFRDPEVNGIVHYMGRIPEAPRYPSLSFTYLKQEEPRVLPLANGKLALIYNGNARSHTSTQHLVFGEMKNGKITFPGTQTIVVYSGKQKNWIPFEVDMPKGKSTAKKLYFVQQFNPLHILEIEDDHSFMLTAHTKTIVKHEHETRLPWLSDLFGSHIRGGTPAILLPSAGVYLSFFHTVIENPPVHAPKEMIKTYYMGALTFNSTYPFNLVAMSEVPVLTPELYSGKWCWEGLDYVMYVMGVFIDPKNDSNVVVSLGWQDQHAVVMKMEIKGLLRSLKPISNVRKI